VVTNAAPLFVPLAEEGWLEGEVPRLAARRYLEPLIAKGVRVIVLGCTHYPLLKAIIQEEARAMAGYDVTVIDTGSAVADEVARFLSERARATSSTQPGTLEALVTDLPKSFEAVASRFLGSALPDVSQIDL
jgi:glutamate racemase